MSLSVFHTQVLLSATVSAAVMKMVQSTINSSNDTLFLTKVFDSELNSSGLAFYSIRNIRNWTLLLKHLLLSQTVMNSNKMGKKNNLQNLRLLPNELTFQIKFSVNRAKQCGILKAKQEQ